MTDLNSTTAMIPRLDDELVLSRCAEKIIQHLERNIERSANHEAQLSKLLLMRTYIKTEILHKSLFEAEA